MTDLRGLTYEQLVAEVLRGREEIASLKSDVEHLTIESDALRTMTVRHVREKARASNPTATVEEVVAAILWYPSRGSF